MWSDSLTKSPFSNKEWKSSGRCRRGRYDHGGWAAKKKKTDEKPKKGDKGHRQIKLVGPPKTLTVFPPLPKPTPCHYHITPQREERPFPIYARACCQNIAFNWCPEFFVYVQMSQKWLINIMEHNEDLQTAPNCRSGVGQCEHSAT